MFPVNKSLAQQLKITESDIQERKDLLGITLDIEETLFSFRDISIQIVDAVVDEFYQKQTSVPAIRSIIGDSETLDRLHNAMRLYVLRLFGGQYDLEYVNSRLRIGKVHARIGVPPKFYVSSLHQLETILVEHLLRAAKLDTPPVAITRIFLFDLQLVFDTYIQGLVSEVEVARDEIRDYSETLERKIEERTAKIISWHKKAN